MTGADSKSKDASRANSRLEAERESLRQAAMSMLAAGKTDGAVDLLLLAVQSLQQDNVRLLQRLATATRARFGRSSEKLNAEELKQLVIAFGATDEQAAAADPLVPTPEPLTRCDEDESSSKKRKKRRNHPGRGVLSPELPRRIDVVSVPADERNCVHCNAEMQCIAHIDSETIEFIPARIEVHVERREKLACQVCRQDIVAAPRVTSEPYQRRAGASLLAHLVESKCDDALPIYRQQDQLRRLGFDIPLNTLYGYWNYVTGLLKPVADVIVSTVLGAPVVGVDDTKLDFLDPGDPRGKQRGHLWCFVGTGPLVGFTFTETWQAEEVEPWISAIDGFVQCDDYKGYGASVRDKSGAAKILVPPERRLGCMMHVRRRFHGAYLGGLREAGKPLRSIAELYRIEARAKELGLSAPERLDLRQRESAPLLDEFDTWVDEHHPRLLPTSPLGAATRYAKDQRVFVRRCFSDGRFEIDNGRVEREIREPAIGRKNFLFAGSSDGAELLASAYTIVQSARRTGVPVRDYLVDVIDRLARGWPARRITELLPDRWAAARANPSADQASKQSQ